MSSERGGGGGHVIAGVPFTTAVDPPQNPHSVGQATWPHGTSTQSSSAVHLVDTGGAIGASTVIAALPVSVPGPAPVPVGAGVLLPHAASTTAIANPRITWPPEA
jgi:hypothetical protein